MLGATSAAARHRVRVGASTISSGCSRIARVENVGIILIGIGGALLAVTHGDAPWGRLALAGALLHVWNHGAVQVAVVLRRRFGAARHRHAGDEPARRIVAHDAVDGGAVRCSARVGDFRAAAAQRVCQRMAGVSRAVRRGDEQAVLRPGRRCRRRSCWRWPGPGDGEFCEGGRDDFLGAPRTKAAEHAHECGTGCAGRCWRWRACAWRSGWRRFYSGRRWPRAVAAWRPAWAAAAAPAPLVTLGLAHVALAVLVAGGGGVVVAAGARRTACGAALTWDCGYARPAARMQYTSASFAGIAPGWFAGFCNRSVKCAGPAATSRRRPSVWSGFLKRCWSGSIGPVSVVIVQVSTAVRRLQHGRLAVLHPLSCVAGLIALGILVMLGGEHANDRDPRHHSAAGVVARCSHRCCRASSTR